MTIQLSIAVRNARLNTIEATVGTAAKLGIRTGAQPIDCASANSGTLLATLTLQSDWMAAAADGSKAKLGTWAVAAVGAGVAAHWRLYESDGVTCHAQGTITGTGGGGNMTLDNTSIAEDQVVTVTGFTLTDANA